MYSHLPHKQIICIDGGFLGGEPPKFADMTCEQSCLCFATILVDYDFSVKSVNNDDCDDMKRK